MCEKQEVCPTLLDMTFSDGTPLRALITAAVIGTLLTVINHGDVLLEGSLPPIWKIILTYCVPYCVTTWGAVTGKTAEWRRRNRGSRSTIQSEKS